VYAYVCARVCACVYVCVCLCMYAFVCVYVCAFRMFEFCVDCERVCMWVGLTCVCVFVCGTHGTLLPAVDNIYACVGIYMHLYAYIYACLYTFIHIYVYMPTSIVCLFM